MSLVNSVGLLVTGSVSGRRAQREGHQAIVLTRPVEALLEQSEMLGAEFLTGHRAPDLDYLRRILSLLDSGVVWICSRIIGIGASEIGRAHV